MKVLLSDNIAEAAIAELKKAGIEVSVQTGLKEAELIQIIPPFDVIVVRSGTKVTAKVIKPARNLKLIVRAGVGLDNVDVAAAAKRRIRVENTPHATTVSVAEHTLALMLALVRHIPQADDSLRRGEWDRKSYQGTELKGKTLAVIGLGRIGQEVAKRAKAFGMTVVATDQAADEEIAEALEIELLSLDQVLKDADVVTIHLPLTQETHHLFNLKLLKGMQKGAYLINASRGGIVEEAALVEVLQKGHLKGAAIDVFEAEPLPKGHPLLKLKQVVAVPHLGAATDEGQLRAGHEAAHLVIAFAKGCHCEEPKATKQSK
ncbi:MAG: hydroxyacid dehydrogenase [Deltaproteobacteria bacterium]|nr:hydroxyacid dehydrogenase [Deltaproteobacteria bacterium]